MTGGLKESLSVTAAVAALHLRGCTEGGFALTADIEEQDKKAQQAHVQRLWEMIAEQRALPRDWCVSIC